MPPGCASTSSACSRAFSCCGSGSEGAAPPTRSRRRPRSWPPRRTWRGARTQTAISDSLVALLVGFGLAVVIGTAIGYALGWWNMLGRTLDPYIAALYVVPIASLVPVLIVWFGFGLSTTVVVVFLFAIFEPLIVAEAAVRTVDRSYVDVARTFGAAGTQTARKVVLPATLPFVLPASAWPPAGP